MSYTGNTGMQPSERNKKTVHTRTRDQNILLNNNPENPGEGLPRISTPGERRCYTQPSNQGPSWSQLIKEVARYDLSALAATVSSIWVQLFSCLVLPSARECLDPHLRGRQLGVGSSRSQCHALLMHIKAHLAK